MDDLKTTKVNGTDRGHVVLFGLSTCIWCRKTKDFLESNDVAFEYIFVDELQGDEKESVKQTIKKWNPSCSYPTLIVNNSSCIVGFEEDRIKTELKL